MSKKMYVGVDNIAKTVNTAYIGVNNIAKTVKKAYVGVGGKARLFYSNQGVIPVYYEKGLNFLYKHDKGGAVTNTQGNKIIAISCDSFRDYYYKAEMIYKNRVKVALTDSDGASFVGFANSKDHAIFVGGHIPTASSTIYSKSCTAYDFSSGVKITLTDIKYRTKGITGTGFNNNAVFAGGISKEYTNRYYFRFDENLVYHDIEVGGSKKSNGVCMAASNHGVFTCGGDKPDKDVPNIHDKNFIRINISGLPDNRLLHASNAVGLLENIIMCGGTSSTYTSDISSLQNPNYTKNFLYSINKNFVASSIGSMSLSGCPNANTNKIMAVICPDPYNKSRRDTLEIYNSQLIRTYILHENVYIDYYSGWYTDYEKFYAFYKCYLGDSIFFSNQDDSSMMAEVAFV